MIASPEMGLEDYYHIVLELRDFAPIGVLEKWSTGVMGL